MLLSDRDIRAAIDQGRITLEPYDAEMVQPSSVDVRIDRYFRVFENHRYPHIDPAAEQTDLTRPVEPVGEEPFILHPGEFALGSIYEVVTLPTVERTFGLPRCCCKVDSLTTWYLWPMQKRCTQPRLRAGPSGGMTRGTGSINRRCSTGWIGCARRSVSIPDRSTKRHVRPEHE